MISRLAISGITTWVKSVMISAFSEIDRRRNTEPTTRWHLTIMAARLSSARAPLITPMMTKVPSMAKAFIFDVK